VKEHCRFIPKLEQNSSMKSFLLVVCTFLSLTLTAQVEKDSMLLLNGKVILGDISNFSTVNADSALNYTFTKKNGKKLSHHISSHRIFSYTKAGSSTTIYQPNEFMGDFLSVNETKAVTIGSYDARKTFKPHVAFWTGFALGFGASIWDTYLTEKEAFDSTLVAPKVPGFFKGKPSVFPFFVPVVLSISWSFPSFRLKGKKIIHKKYTNNENYYRGYHRIAKQKRMLGALVGSLSGISLGMIIHYSAQ
jgi:hypothetical protein